MVKTEKDVSLTQNPQMTFLVKTIVVGEGVKIETQNLGPLGRYWNFKVKE